MKRIIALLSTLALAYGANAQNAAISSNPAYAPHESAILDLNASDKGLLIPRVKLDNARIAGPIANPAKGLMVFNDGGLLEEGFWYWNGNSWNKIDFTNADNISKPSLITAEMYEEGPSDMTTISLTNADTFYGWVSAKNGFTTGSPYINFQEDAVADRLVVGAEGAGKYRVNFTASIQGASSSLVTGAVFRNGIMQPNVVIIRHMNSTGDIGTVAVNGTIDLKPGDYIDVRFSSSSKVKDLNLYVMNLQIIRLAK